MGKWPIYEAHRRYRRKSQKAWYWANKAYVLKRNAEWRRRQPDIWYARYFEKMHAFIARAVHKRYLVKRYERIQSGDLRFDETGVAIPKPPPSVILRVRSFGRRW